MKNIKPKKLDKRINIICDFSIQGLGNSPGDTNPTGTDPTNTTIITLTTISSPNKVTG